MCINSIVWCILRLEISFLNPYLLKGWGNLILYSLIPQKCITTENCWVWIAHLIIIIKRKNNKESAPLGVYLSHRHTHTQRGKGPLNTVKILSDRTDSSSGNRWCHRRTRFLLAEPSMFIGTFWAGCPTEFSFCKCFHFTLSPEIQERCEPGNISDLHLVILMFHTGNAERNISKTRS